ADEEGVDEHADTETEGDGFEGGVGGVYEAGEHGEHDQRGGGADSRRLAAAANDRSGRVLALDVGLADAGDHEHLVVHGQAEQDRDEDDRQKADHRAGGAGADQVVGPAPLEDSDDGAEGRPDGQQEPGGGLDRHDDRPERDEQQQEGEPDHKAGKGGRQKGGRPDTT